MKTAAKFYMTALAAVLGIGLVSASGVHAQAPSGSDAGPITTSVPGPASAQQAAASPSIDLPTVSETKKKSKAKATGSDNLGPSPEIPDSVQNVVERLNTATQDVTLEDLNSAREAVVKLDVLIDIEKRLNDLTTLRKEREDKSAPSLSASIPSSALDLSRPPSISAGPIPSMGAALPAGFPNMAGMGNPMGDMAVPSSALGSMSGRVEVSRIIGTRGHYSAIVRESSGQTKTVRKGDKLSDGSLVEAISRKGVRLVKNKKSKTIQVKDITEVFGEQ